MSQLLLVPLSTPKYWDGDYPICILTPAQCQRVHRRATTAIRMMRRWNCGADASLRQLRFDVEFVVAPASIVQPGLLREGLKERLSEEDWHEWGDWFDGPEEARTVSDVSGLLTFLPTTYADPAWDGFSVERTESAVTVTRHTWTQLRAVFRDCDPMYADSPIDLSLFKAVAESI